MLVLVLASIKKNCDYKKSGAETLMEIFSEYFDAMHIEKKYKRIYFRKFRY